jgi:hypothetical protein
MIEVSSPREHMRDCDDRDISDVVEQRRPREAIKVDGKWNPALCYIWHAMVQPSPGPRLELCWIPSRLVAQRI